MHVQRPKNTAQQPLISNAFGAQQTPSNNACQTWQVSHLTPPNHHRNPFSNHASLAHLAPRKHRPTTTHLQRVWRPTNTIKQRVSNAAAFACLTPLNHHHSPCPLTCLAPSKHCQTTCVKRGSVCTPNTSRPPPQSLQQPLVSRTFGARKTCPATAHLQRVWRPPNNVK